MPKPKTYASDAVAMEAAFNRRYEACRQAIKLAAYSLDLLTLHDLVPIGRLRRRLDRKLTQLRNREAKEARRAQTKPSDLSRASA